MYLHRRKLKRLLVGNTFYSICECIEFQNRTVIILFSFVIILSHVILIGFVNFVCISSLLIVLQLTIIIIITRKNCYC